MEKHITLIECPRDAMQGIHTFIPTAEKTSYINKLLKVGFDVLDCGSFVSPKVIPQMQDTSLVLAGLDLELTKTKLLVIIANITGAELAATEEKIRFLGYPFSISETFQERNTNRKISVAFDDVKRINQICKKTGKELVLYISMGFGNPYGDPWNSQIVEDWLKKLIAEGITTFSLADTVGNAKINDIKSLFTHLISKYPDLEIGAHFHSTPQMQIQKIETAYYGGCRRFDSAILGYGGCPMASDQLTGNISTEAIIQFLESKNIRINIDADYFREAEVAASFLFGNYN
jgi:hydroxymethylglutaryl-CoA lyase